MDLAQDGDRGAQVVVAVVRSDVHDHGLENLYVLGDVWSQASGVGETCPSEGIDNGVFWYVKVDR